MVSEFNEMINLFNILKSLNVLYNFQYKIELFKNKISDVNYYKIIITTQKMIYLVTIFLCFQ